VEKVLKETQAPGSPSRRNGFLGQLAAGVAHEVNNPLTGFFLCKHGLEQIGQRGSSSGTPGIHRGRCESMQRHREKPARLQQTIDNH